MTVTSQVRPVLLPDESETAAFARSLASLLRPGDVVALHGDLGAGTTTVARALINALPGPREEVPSPTFTLVQIYERGPVSVWHIDLYRIDRPEDALELGLEEAFAEAICLIEWPERLGSFLPADALRLDLGFADDESGRRAELSGGGTWPERLERLGHG